MRTLEELDKLVEELGIETMTPISFKDEQRRLEQLFKENYGLHPAMITPLIKDGDIQDCDLVQEWIELMALEPYLFPREQRRRPPDMKSEESHQGRESGPFRFWSRAAHRSNRLYWRLWTSMRRTSFARRSSSSEPTSQGWWSGWRGLRERSFRFHTPLDISSRFVQVHAPSKCRLPIAFVSATSASTLG